MCVVCRLYNVFVFFFKQKTAYEMRISDWSSDVCSSDLRRRWGARAGGQDRAPPFRTAPPLTLRLRAWRVLHHRRSRARGHACPAWAGRDVAQPGSASHWGCGGRRFRSEEHTSELQSLMRISYAVFCLKKTKTNTKIHKVHT